MTCSCILALSIETAAWLATLASTSRSESVKRLRWLSVSIWITPIGSPSLPIIGAQIIERMEKSAMLWAMPNRSSLAASAERIALRDFMASSTIVRLIRIRSSSPARRFFTATGTSGPSASGRMTTKPRSACMKILNRLSSIFGRMSSTASVCARLFEISISAASFTSGLAESRQLAEPRRRRTSP